LKEHKLHVFENKVLRKIHGYNNNKVKHNLKLLFNEEVHDLYRSRRTVRDIQSRRLQGAGHVVTMGQTERENAQKPL
jgi:hypothetical protein